MSVFRKMVPCFQMCKLTIWLVVSCVALWVRIAMMLTCMQLLLNECRAKSTFDKKTSTCMHAGSQETTRANQSPFLPGPRLPVGRGRAVRAGLGVAVAGFGSGVCWTRIRVYKWCLQCTTPPPPPATRAIAP
jgi:hypothetical protein